MSVRKLQTSREVSLARQDEDESYEIRVYEDKNTEKLQKQRVYQGTKKHFTKIQERNSKTKKDITELYYGLEEGETPLEDYRLEASDEESKQDILDGLLELFFLVSEGKVYNVELNPFNFIMAEDKQVKAFYREDRGLREITDDWLYEVKKLIGYFLVSDTKYNEDNYATLKPKDFYRSMEDNIAGQYLKIMRSNSLDQMIQEWFTETAYRQLKGFPSMMKAYKKPDDVTSLSVALGLEEEEEGYEEEEEDKKVTRVKKDGNIGKKLQGLTDKVKGNKVLMYIGISLVAVLLIAVVVGLVSSNKQEAESDGKEEQNKVVGVNQTYYDGAVKASIQNYEEASEIYKTLSEDDINSLEEDERVSIYLTYLKVGEYDEALKVDPKGVETLIKYLNKHEKIAEVKNMETDHPVINFEKAVLDEEFSTVIELRSKVRDTESRRASILRAYVYSGDLDGAVEYVKEKDSKEMKTQLESIYETYSKEKKVKKEDKKKDQKNINKL